MRIPRTSIWTLTKEWKVQSLSVCSGNQTSIFHEASDQFHQLNVNQKGQKNLAENPQKIQEAAPRILFHLDSITKVSDTSAICPWTSTFSKFMLELNFDWIFLVSVVCQIHARAKNWEWTKNPHYSRTNSLIDWHSWRITLELNLHLEIAGKKGKRVHLSSPRIPGTAKEISSNCQNYPGGNWWKWMRTFSSIKTNGEYSKRKLINCLELDKNFLKTSLKFPFE